MARRIAGIICFASALMMILWLATGATASGFVKFLLLGIVGSILALYKFDDLAARLPSAAPVKAVEPPSDGGVFGTDLPTEAFGEPVIETKTVNLRRGVLPTSAPRAPLFKSNGAQHSDDSDLTEIPDLPDVAAEVPDTAEVLHEADVPDTPIVVSSNGNGSSAPAGHSVELTHAPVALESRSNANGQSVEVATTEPTFIQLADYTNDDLSASVRAGEASLVSALTETGMLSTEGELTDTDVATMVFVAVSSDDLLRALLAGKEAEAQAAALSYTVDTPELYEPAPQLVEPRI